jgi:hypothetical protein
MIFFYLESYVLFLGGYVLGATQPFGCRTGYAASRPGLYYGDAGAFGKGV